MQTIESAKIPTIIGESRLSTGSLRYWKSAQRKLAGKVGLIDPFRQRLSVLRMDYPKGTVVYRASTGGTHGKSSSIDTL